MSRLTVTCHGGTIVVINEYCEDDANIYRLVSPSSSTTNFIYRVGKTATTSEMVRVPMNWTFV